VQKIPAAQLARLAPDLRRRYETQWSAPGATDVSRRALNVEFEALIPRLDDPALRMESRKYYGAALVLLGRREEAIAEFRRILDEDYRYDINRIAFASEVIDVWGTVRRQFLEDRQRRIDEEAAREQARLDALARYQVAHGAWLAELRARSTTTEEHASRWIAMIPFGFGQFQNETDAFGWALVIAGGVLAATSVTTYLLHENYRDEVARTNISEAERARGLQIGLGLRVANWVSTGLLGLVAIGGIVDAQIRFVPVHERPRPDPPPPEPQPDDPEFTVTVGLVPAGLGAALTF
jgi:tetratricopeptide (TPR) repeat protein